MRKKLSLLKPYVHIAVINNKWMEKVSYLKIPSLVDVKNLRADVKMGAVQFSQLDELIVKENEPKYILINTDSLEQGYLAVTYLAAGFNRKHDMDADEENDEHLDETESNLSEWDENPRQIPVIHDYEFRMNLFEGENNSTFGVNDIFMMGGQNSVAHMPYWMGCTHDSVCIIARAHFGICAGDAYESKEAFILGLNYFRGNDKVYIIYVQESSYYGGWEEEDLDECFISEARNKWNYIVLNFLADEVSVYLKKEDRKKYYRLLVRGNFSANGISVKKGFNYGRLVNIVAAMADRNKCKLVENVIKYAVKDWKSPGERPIENRDFDFMDRFCRAYPVNEANKERKTGSARERMMQELIGMEDVKTQILNIVNVMKYNQIRLKMGFSGGGYQNVHVMLGAPGTAKTTMAKLMGQLMVEERLLSDNRFICVNGAELKGKYVGHSAPKTKEVFEENDIIVIDEAYSLVGDNGDSDSFTKEALAQLVIELENHSTDKLVIFAGYGGRKVSDRNNKMKDFLDANPGIKSRITSTIYFDSYSPDDMVRIFFKLAENSQYHPDEGTREALLSYFRKRAADDNFGNGREARKLLETAVVYTASRVLAEDKKAYTREEMQRILYEDVEKAIKELEYGDSIQNVVQAQRKIGFIRNM